MPLMTFVHNSLVEAVTKLFQTGEWKQALHSNALERSDWRLRQDLSPFDPQVVAGISTLAMIAEYVDDEARPTHTDPQRPSSPARPRCPR